MSDRLGLPCCRAIYSLMTTAYAGLTFRLCATDHLTTSIFHRTGLPVRGPSAYSVSEINQHRQETPMQRPSAQTLYDSKRGSADAALDLLRDGDFIILPSGAGERPA